MVFNEGLSYFVCIDIMGKYGLKGGKLLWDRKASDEVRSGRREVAVGP